MWVVGIILIALVAASGIFGAIMFPAVSMFPSPPSDEVPERGCVESPTAVVVDESRQLVRARSTPGYGGVQHRPQPQLLGYL